MITFEACYIKCSKSCTLKITGQKPYIRKDAETNFQKIFTQSLNEVVEKQTLQKIKYKADRNIYKCFLHGRHSNPKIDCTTFLYFINDEDKFCLKDTVIVE